MRIYVGARAAVAFLLCFTSGIAPVHAGDGVVDEVVELAKAKALNRSVPNWPVVEREAQALAAATPGEAGRTAAIRHVLASLQDHHSSYRPPAQAAEPRPPSGASGTAYVRPPIAVAAAPSGGAGRLVINAWTGGPEAVPGAAQTVRTELNKALSGSTCGLVIDLTANHGGNMWPMMGGIAPLYDEGVLETFEAGTGERQVVNVTASALRMNESPYPHAELAPMVTAPKRLALVIGPKTASSGEILALGFKGQKNVRFFGRPTAGATSANQSIRLSNGGLLALTTARILDRSGAAYNGSVIPDVATDDGVGDAVKWASEECK